MGKKIAMGFHCCVDYELKWDTQTVEDLIRTFDIHMDDLDTVPALDSERNILITCLTYFKNGIGGEMVPENPVICNDFANHFNYEITIGGTASRAAIAISKLGYKSALQTCCYNHLIKELMPQAVDCFSSVGEDHTDIYPHIVLQCAGGVRIRANDIDFVTPRENRVMISRDIDSLNMVISTDFTPMLADAEVFLLSCFSEVLDKEILADRMEKTRALLSALPQDAITILEDGHYVVEGFREYVHAQLAPILDVLSMNEDELQSGYGKRIDILDAHAVLEALQAMRTQTGVKTLVVHSSKWALAYGENSSFMKKALDGGVTMSATRFWRGDAYGTEEYMETKTLPDSVAGAAFCEAISRLAGDMVCALPCKELSFVEHPTVVGLGDSFAGGLLPGLLKENRE